MRAALRRQCPRQHADDVYRLARAALRECGEREPRAPRFQEPHQAGRVLAAEFINQGKAYRAVYFNYAENQGAYYTPDGRNLLAGEWPDRLHVYHAPTLAEMDALWDQAKAVEKSG